MKGFMDRSLIMGIERGGGGGYKMGRMGKFYPNKMGGGKGLSHSNEGGGGHNKF